MSRSAGTGQPAFCKCSECRSVRGHWRREVDSMAGSRIMPTGRVRRRYGRHGGGRYGRHAFEYRCPDCGHVGWTGHNAMARKFRDAGHIMPPG